MSMNTSNSIPGGRRDSTNRVKRSAADVSNPDSPNYDPDSPDYDESLDYDQSLDDSRKNRAQGQGNIGLDAPEMQETLSPAPGEDDTENDSVTFAPPRALGWGGNLASIQPGSIRKGK